MSRGICHSSPIHQLASHLKLERSDLAGLPTQQKNMLEVHLYAPVQDGWLGFFFTTFQHANSGSVILARPRDRAHKSQYLGKEIPAS